MKKLISLSFALLLLISLLCLPAMAEDDNGYVYDSADILTYDEYADLEASAEDMAGIFDCSVYILTVDDYTYYYDGEILDFAEDLYVEWDLGCGDDTSGLFLVLSMADRDYALVTHGYNGNDAFTDYVRSRMEDDFLAEFADDDYYDGFAVYLADARAAMEAAASGETMKPTLSACVSENPIMTIVIVLLIPLGIATLICMLLRSGHKSVAPETRAHNYITNNGIQITVKHDQFTHTTETRRKIEKSDSSSSSGGGFSGSSGKF